MKKAELKSFGKPDEVREFPRGRLELIKVGGAMVGRAIFEPGWKWSTSIQPIAKTKIVRLLTSSITSQALSSTKAAQRRITARGAVFQHPVRDRSGRPGSVS
jgi:hypothetical protein